MEKVKNLLVRLLHIAVVVIIVTNILIPIIYWIMHPELTKMQLILELWWQILLALFSPTLLILMPKIKI